MKRGHKGTHFYGVSQKLIQEGRPLIPVSATTICYDFQANGQHFFVKAFGQ